MRDRDQREIKYPEMRASPLNYIRSLSDVEYQRAHWITREDWTENSKDSFDLSIHFLVAMGP